MNQGPMFLSIKDLQHLMGTQWYNSAQKRHKKIRERIRPGKKDLTIREYCDFTGGSYRQTYQALRGEPPP
jgi:hypothetical protein